MIRGDGGADGAAAVKISPFFKSSLALGSSTLGRLFLGVIKSKVGAIVLGAEGIGLLGLLSQLELLGCSLSSLTLSSGLTRKVSQSLARGDRETRARSLETTLAILGISCSATLLLGALAILYVSNFLPEWRGRWSYLIPLLVAIPARSIITSFVMGAFFGYEKIREYSTCSMIGGVCELLLFLVLVKPLGVAGALWASAFGLVAWLASAIWLMKKFEDSLEFRLPRLDVPIARELISMGLVMSVVGCLSYLCNAFIRFHFLESLSPKDAGIFHVSVIFSSLYMPLLTNGIWARLHPKVSAEDLTDSSRHEWSEAMVFIAFFGSFLQAGIIAFSNLAILMLYTREFLPATRLIPAQMAGDFFFMLSQPTMAVLLARHQLKIYMVVWLAYFAALAAFTVGLSSSFGLLAAPYGYFLASVMLSIFGVAYFVQNSGSVYRTAKMTMAILFSLAAVAGTFLLDGQAIAIKVVVVSLWGLVVFACYFKFRKFFVA